MGFHIGFRWTERKRLKSPISLRNELGFLCQELIFVALTGLSAFFVYSLLSRRSDDRAFCHERQVFLGSRRYATRPAMAARAVPGRRLHAG